MTKKIWTTEEEKQLELLILKYDKKWNEIAREMQLKFNQEYTYEMVRNKYRYMRSKKSEDSKMSIDIEEEKDKFKTEIKSNKDGTMEVKELVELSREKLKDKKYILEAHGYDYKEWDIVEHKFSRWHQHNKIDKTVTLYASSIKIAPKKNVFDESRLIDVIERLPKLKILNVDFSDFKRKHFSYKFFPFFDMHWGIGDYDYYKPLLQESIKQLSFGQEKVLIAVGQDLFHNNDFQGRTVSGREIQKVNMEKAFEDAYTFYVQLINFASKSSWSVEVVFSKGNHDEFSSWSLVKCLEKTFKESKNIKFDTRNVERKVVMLGNNFIGINHGDKKQLRKLAENFATEFPNEWSRATTREVFTGHLHREEVQVLDESGIVLRRMPSGVPTDKWHEDQGYTTAHKRFQIFEYDENSVLGIKYL